MALVEDEDHFLSGESPFAGGPGPEHPVGQHHQFLGREQAVPAPDTPLLREHAVALADNGRMLRRRLVRQSFCVSTERCMLNRADRDCSPRKLRNQMRRKSEKKLNQKRETQPPRTDTAHPQPSR